MEGASRILLDALEKSSFSSQQTAVKALEVAAVNASKEDAASLRLIGDAIHTKPDYVASAFRSMLSETADADISALNKTVLKDVNISSLNKEYATALSNEEIKSLKVLVDKIASKFPDNAIESITKFNEREQREMMNAISREENRIVLNDTRYLDLPETDVAIKSHIEKIITETAKKEPKFATIINVIGKSLKVGVAVGAVSYVSAWIASYMKSNSGPFVTKNVEDDFDDSPVDSKNEHLALKLKVKQKLHKDRIRDPYPCGFTDKSGTVRHPIDGFIRAYVPIPCTDWKQWDACGGWTTVTNQSRLYQALPQKPYRDAVNFLQGAKLSCENVSVNEAFVALVHEAGHTVGSAVKEGTLGLFDGLGIQLNTILRLCCVLVSCVIGYYAYRITRDSLSTKMTYLITVTSSISFLVISMFLLTS